MKRRTFFKSFTLTVCGGVLSVCYSSLVFAKLKNIKKMLDSYSKDLGADNWKKEVQNAEKRLGKTPHSKITKLVEKDFKEGNIEVIDGWHLAKTEVQYLIISDR